MKHTLLYSTVALFGAALTASAQETSNVPVNATVVQPDTQIQLELSNGGAIGEISQSDNSDCIYYYTDGVLRVADTQAGESVISPGTSTNGCFTDGTPEHPALILQCTEGTVLPIEIDFVYESSVLFGSDGFRIGGTQYTNTQATNPRTFNAVCPAYTEENNGFHEIEMDLRITTPSAGNGNIVPLGDIQADIPFTINFE